MAVTTQFLEGQAIGTIWGKPAICKIDKNGKKLITQQIVAKDGKVGYVFRGRAIFVDNSTAGQRISTMTLGDIDQFEASDTLGWSQPAGIVFDDLEISYQEDGNGVYVWQKKSDITASAVETVINGTSVARSADALTAITDFIAAYWLYIVLALVLVYVLWFMPMKDGKKKKKGFLG